MKTINDISIKSRQSCLYMNSYD